MVFFHDLEIQVGENIMNFADLRSLNKKMPGVVFLGLILLLASCENLIKGADVKKQLDDQIAWANAKECTLFVKTNPDYGTFLSDGEKKCKVGYTTEIQFTVNQDSYNFIGFEAVSSNDNSKSRNDFVEFKFNKSESNPDDGIYKYTIKLLHEAGDILIRPVCKIYPRIIQSLPSSETIAYANAQIIVTLNSQIDEKLLRYAKDYIMISNNGEDLTSLFEKPCLNSVKSVVTISPKGKSVYDYISETYLDIEVSFGEKIVKQDENSIFTVRYKKETETVKPSKYEFFAATQDSFLDSNGVLTIPSEGNRFTNEDIAQKGSFTDEEYKERIRRNRTNGILYIYGRYYDADSGIYAVQITRQRTNDKNGNTVSQVSVPDPLYTKYSNNTKFYENKGYTNFYIKYQIPDDEQQEDLGDGAILINVIILDGAGNKSEPQSFTAIKDNYVDLSKVNFRNYQADYYAINSRSWQSTDYSSVEDFLNKEIIPLTKWISLTSFKNSKDYEPLPTYRDICLKECPKDNVYIEYQSKNGSTRQKMEWNDQSNIFETNIDVDSLNGLTLKLCVTDDLGHTNTRDFIFPGNLEVYPSYYIGKGDGTDAYYGYRIKPASSYVLSIRKDSDKYIASREDGSNCFNNERLYFANINNFVGDFTKVTGTLPTTQENKSFASFSGMHFDGNKCYIHFKDDVWSKYSHVICKGEFSYWIGTYSNALLNNSPDGMHFDTGWCKKETVINNGDGKETILYCNHNILDYYLVMKLTLCGIDSNGKVIAKTQTQYTINEKKETQHTTYGVSNDNKSPVINKITVLKPAERVEKLGTDAAYLDSWLVVNASDFYVDSSNNIYYSDIKSFDVYTNDIKTGSFNVSELKKLSSNEYAAPLYGRYANKNTSYKIIAYDNNGNASTASTGTVNSASENNCYNISKVDYKNGKCDISINKKLPNEYWSLEYFGLYAYKLDNEKWNLVQSFTDPKNISLAVDPQSIYKFVPDVHVYMNMNRWAFNTPYILNTNEQSSGDYDLVMPNLGSNSSIAISSDQPVFVQTIVTTQSLSTCKNWTVQQWEQNFPRHLGDKLIEFSPEDHSFKRYNIPVDQIKTGECYVVIIHYSNGTVQKTDVMQK